MNTKSKVKKAPTGYIIFCSENREEVKKLNPDANFGQIGKILGKMWTKLSDAERNRFKKESDRRKMELQGKGSPERSQSPKMRRPHRANINLQIEKQFIIHFDDGSD